MPQALVSDQLNQDVMRGFLTGFQHAATLIQSQKAQDEENKREQMRLDAEAQKHQETIRNQWALKAMQIGIDADKFKRQSAKQRSDTINKNTHAAAVNVLNNQRQQYASELSANRNNITNASDYERAIRSVDSKIVKMGQIKPGADGMYDQNQIDGILQEDAFVAPKYKPEYLQKQQLDLRKKQLDIKNEGLTIDKKEQSLAGGSGDKEHEKVRKAIAKARTGLLTNVYKVSTAGVMVDAGRKRYGSDEAWAKAAEDDKTGEGQYRSKALGDLNSANKWSSTAVPFLQMLSDPSVVGDDVATLVNSTKSAFNNLQSPVDLTRWLAHLGQTDNSHPTYKKLYNFINGSAVENAAANVPDETPAPETGTPATEEDDSQ